VGTSFFSRTTSLDAAGAGHFTGSLDPGWNCPIVPQGGITTAVAARAMTMALEHEEQSLRSITAVFAAPVGAGPIEADVTVLRRGRSMSQCSVTVRNPGAPAGLTAVAVFGARREGFEFTDLFVPPDVLAPEECPSFRDPVDDVPEDFEFHEPFPFWAHVEGKPVIGHPPWEDYEPASSLTAKWARFDDPPRSDDGTWDPLAVLALADTMPSSVGEKLGPAHRNTRWLPPSADFTVHLFGEARCEWLLQVNRARHAGDGYASLDMETWDVEGPEPRLVAYATQMMFFSFPKD
jgi:acyl-CoA thioesterase